jgi:predicted metal-dependent peptidase
VQPTPAPQTEKKEAKQEKVIPVDPHYAKALEKANDLLEETVMELVFNQPFYANLIQNMRREFTTKLPTLGVNVTDQVNLFVNPYFFASMTLPQRVDILKHECHHVINNHFVRFRDLEPKIFDGKDKSLFEKIQDMQKASTTNKAADAAINEYLPQLPRKIKLFDQVGQPIVEPKVLPDGKGGTVPNPSPTAGKPVEASLIFVDELKKKYTAMLNKQTMEYYYEFLKEKQDKSGGKDGTEGMIVLDDHDIWHESGNSEDEITEKVKEVVNKAVEQTDEKKMGELGADILQQIEALNHVPKDWRQDVQRFSARCAEILIESTRKRRNRRYGILYPGIKIFPKLNLTIGMDTSGSVGDEELSQFHAEMVRLHNMGISLTVIECDAQVNQVYKFDPKKPFKVMGRGGTQFKPVFDYIEKNKLETDGLIYFTDGECYGETLKKPKFPVLWALTPPFKLYDSVKFGSTTKVEIKKKVRR